MAIIRFGTDGWRGLIARDFTFDNVALCAQGVASYLHKEGRAGDGLVVGYDTRFASEEFAGVVAEVMAGNGIVTFLSDRAAPTPVVSYNILHHKACRRSHYNRKPQSGPLERIQVQARLRRQRQPRGNRTAGAGN